MDKKDLQAAKLKMVQDAIEQVRRTNDDPPECKKPKAESDRKKKAAPI